MEELGFKSLIALMLIFIIIAVFFFFAQISACENAGGDITYNWLNGQWACVNSDGVVIVP